MTFNAECHDTLNAMIQEWTKRKRLQPLGDFGASDLLNARGMTSRGRVAQTIREDRYVAPCTAGRVLVVLHSDGSVYPCEMLDQKMGNVRDHAMDLPALLQTTEARAIATGIVKNKCYCTYECAWSVNALFSPQNWPLLLKEYVALKLG